MPVIKCRFCGGNVNAELGNGLARCEGCGLVSTVPFPCNDTLASHLNRANYYRRTGEFQRADSAYSEILLVEPDCAEAHFGRAMSRFQVIYQKTPDGSYAPVSSSVEKERFLSDSDYHAALRGALPAAAEQLRREAMRISGLADDSKKQTDHEISARQKISAEYTTESTRTGINKRGKFRRILPKNQPTAKKRTSWKQTILNCSLVLLLLAVLCIGGWLFTANWIIPQNAYHAAESLLASGARLEAIHAFQQLDGFRDSEDRAVQIQSNWYREAEQLLLSGQTEYAAMSFGSMENYADATARSLALWDQIVGKHVIAAGGWYSVALQPTAALGVGDNREAQCHLIGWSDIVSISAGWSHTVGRRADGSVIAAGYNADGRGAVVGWENIVDISAGQWHTVGLQMDGTVIGTGCTDDGRLDFSEWSDVCAVSAGRNHSMGLLANGTVLAVGRNVEGQCRVSDWSNIIQVSAGGEHSLGLRKDGTVAAAGSNQDGQCAVTTWQGITEVAAGYYHSVALKADGTVVAVGSNLYGQCDVSSWKNIVAIAAGGWHTLGLCADGTVVSTGRNVNGQCDTQEWRNVVLSSS